MELRATDTERQQGLDLADYLTPFDYREFQTSPQSETDTKDRYHSIHQTLEVPSHYSQVGNKMDEGIEIASKGSFLGNSGKFYIHNPVDPKSYAVYDSPEAYDNRLHIPSYINKVEAEDDFKNILPIDAITLTTIKIKNEFIQ